MTVLPDDTVSSRQSLQVLSAHYLDTTDCKIERKGECGVALHGIIMAGLAPLPYTEPTSYTLRERMPAIFGMGAFAAPSMSSGSGTDRMVPAEPARLAQTCANAGVPTLAVRCLLSI